MTAVQTLFLLFYEFFFTGLLAVGGGYATIPFLQSIGRRRPYWYSGEQLAGMIAGAQCVPGPFGTNMATFVGFTVGGLAGAAFSLVALMTPTVVIGIIAAGLMDRFRSSARMEALMQLLRPASAGLICAAAFSLLQISLASGSAWDWREPLSWLRWFDWRCLALYGALLPFAFWKKLKKVHPLAYVAVGALAGIAVGL